ncbi:MAG TPA: sigma factor-like helix-turn-helix DNA-binding protein, partial [Vicinamibacterales bacterium]|nr:sigma factor-like helix-turn-helix DNA-binding protein [Vicinamibacterales bacterium]
EPLAAPASSIDPDRARFVTAMRTVLSAAIAALAPRDRFKLACYYAQQMTLAQIAKLTREHEATVSRQLARVRRDIRRDVEARLQRDHGFSTAEVDECFSAVVSDSGDFDLDQWLGRPHGVTPTRARKNPPADRSMNEEVS